MLVLSRTTIPFLLEILDTPEFRAGQVDTKFLERWVEQRATAAT